MAVLGSSARCKVRLYDPNVSKHHCALLRTPSGLWVIDLLGRDGITVNGESVRFAPLGGRRRARRWAGSSSVRRSPTG